MKTELVKFDKHADSWNIGFDITLTDEELSLCDMDTRKRVKGCEVKLIGNVMSFNYILIRKI